jgi:hypothetical protein
MVTEVTVYECDSCGQRHDDPQYITECKVCNCEICTACEEDTDICGDCFTDDEEDEEDDEGNEESQP